MSHVRVAIAFDGKNFWATIDSDVFIMPAKIASQYVRDGEVRNAYRATQGDNWPQERRERGCDL